MKILRPLPDNCTGCRLCVMSCSFFHDQSFSQGQARLYVRADVTTWKFEPVVCRQCDDAPCAAACPSGALSRDLNTGAVRLDAEACTGCEACVPACPYEAILFDRDRHLAQLCDLCQGKPECVAACPHSAILFTNDQTAVVAPTWFGEPILK